jgi:CRP-like cAMP-binding protein
MPSSEDEFPTRAWGPCEVIYDFDAPSFHCYFIIEGSVNIFTPRGLKLNTIGKSEIFGEASLLLGKKRSVIAKSDDAGVKVLEISKNYILGLQESSPVLSAILRNVQLRLQDSNAQSVKYAAHVENLLKIATDQNDKNQLILERLESIKKQLADDFRVD